MDRVASFPLPLEYIKSEYSNYASEMTWLSQEQVLELGCGLGLISRKVLQPMCESHFAHLLAIDRAPEAIVYAQAHCHHRDITYRHVPDLSTRSSVPVELRGAFSKLFYYGGAMPCSEGSGLRQASLLLDIRGCCVLILPVRCCLFDVLKQLADSARWKAYMLDAMRLVPPQCHWQDPQEAFQKEARKVGMEVNKLELSTTEVTFTSSTQFQEFLSWAMPFVVRIPKESRPAFLDEALKLCGARSEDCTRWQPPAFYHVPQCPLHQNAQRMTCEFELKVALTPILQDKCCRPAVVVLIIMSPAGSVLSGCAASCLFV